MAKAELLAAMAALDLTVESEFVPWSRSRSVTDEGKKDPLKRNLNWRVTLKRNGREILSTDYSAGCAHCPGYKQFWGKPPYGLREVIDYETEEGKAGRWSETFHNVQPATRAKPIKPEPEAVVWSLAQESSVIDYPTYEQWAPEFGYDLDSRTGEAIYRACLEIALKMRAGLGEDGLAQLAKAGEDY